MFDRHISSQFDEGLNILCAKLMHLGDLVELQTQLAIRAFIEKNLDFCNQVITREKTINSLEIEIDSACAELIARRQPTANDLRLIMAISKAVTNLERVGDEAERIALRSKHIISQNVDYKINASEINHSGQLAIKLLRQSLDSFSHLDVISAAKVFDEDKKIDKEFGEFVNKLIAHMADYPKMVPTGLDYLFIAKAIERIGDHAKNISEFVIYAVNGLDIRHLPSQDKGRFAK